ncbi:MAG: helix-turn-helix transcriptional regulator [Ignavibacteria bacterium]|nr:helix-turn-helix transcriptional regulator [Ignavibacteria bacterium]
MKKQGIASRDKFLKEIGIKISQRRNLLGISQEELADKADLDRTYISGIERGKRNVSVFTLKKIIDSLDLKLIDFFNGSIK